MSERNTTIKIFGLILTISILFVFVVGCQGGQSQSASSENPPSSSQDQNNNVQSQQNNTQAKKVSGPRVLFFTAEW